MNSLYRQEMLEDARNPKSYRKMNAADFVLDVVNPTCGDELTIYLKTKRAKGRGKIIQEASFLGRGCMVMMASTSRVIEKLPGKTVQTARRMTEKEILKMFGAPLTSGRIMCALLPREALRKIPNTK